LFVFWKDSFYRRFFVFLHSRDGDAGVLVVSSNYSGFTTGLVSFFNTFFEDRLEDIFGNTCSSELFLMRSLLPVLSFFCFFGGVFPRDFYQVVFYFMSSSQNPVLVSIIRIIQDCFHNQNLYWSLKTRDSKKQILSFGIGSMSIYFEISGDSAIFLLSKVNFGHFLAFVFVC
jgi:hypothetical protein